jgi:adenosylcobinamide-phosphate synthase
VLSGLSAFQAAWLLAAGVALDLLLGEARRWHPLVGFGRMAAFIETRLNHGRWLLLRGGFGWMLAVLPATLLAWWLAELAGLVLHALLLYFSLGLRSLREHTLPIFRALQDGDLPAARALTSRIVSRDTAHEDASGLARAGAESLLENGNDAVFGALFWFVIAGGPGALLFRLANTLDAMWGYRTQRYNLFGRMAARIDDVLNYLPARLTALSYVLLAPRGGHLRAWRCWRLQAPAWSSPNAGPVMASGAGALGIALGGAATYDGEREQRPPLGSGGAAGPFDIVRAWRLVLHATLLWIVLALALALAIGGPSYA